MMTNPFLLLWLESPLQAWGFDSKFGRRDTQTFPTKSGVLGLICCALGAGGEQKKLLKDFSDLSLSILSFMKNEQEPLLRDFHVVGNGYDDKDPWQSLLTPRTTEGKKAVGGGAKLTYRYYLQDMAFAVIMEVPADMAVDLAEALQNPVWDLYLGRKNCIPTDFIYRGTFLDEKEAIGVGEQIGKAKTMKENLRVFGGELRGDVMILNDVPIQFGEHKMYRDRQVTVIKNE